MSNFNRDISVLCCVVAFTGLISVRQVNAQWTALDAHATANSVGSFGTSLLVVNGRPAIAYYDSTNFRLLYVRANDAVGSSWGTPVAADPDGSSSVGRYPSMAIVNGHPAIAYLKNAGEDVRYVRANDADGASWGTPVNIDVHPVNRTGYHNSLAVVNGKPAIAYQDVTNTNPKYVAALDIDGATWGTPVALDVSASNLGAYASLAEVNGNPAIAYADLTNFNVRYIQASVPDGSAWNAPIAIDVSGDIVGYFTSLEVVNGNPAIAYSDDSNTNVRYVRATNADGSAWGTPISLDVSSSTVGAYTSLAIVNGNPAIAYYDATNTNARYVRAMNANGTLWGLPVAIDVSASSVGDYISLAEVSGNPAIAYYDSTNTNLRYAYYTPPISPTPTVSASPTPSPTLTPTPTITPTVSPTPTPCVDIYSYMHMLKNPTPDAQDYYGWSVAASGNTIVVGAYLDDPGGIADMGIVYVYDAVTGALQLTLTDPWYTSGDRFGSAVAMDGNLIAVGASGAKPGGVTSVGLAFVFDASTGSLIATLANPDPTVNDRFGISISISGTLVVVGADGDDPAGISSAGSAYVFDATTGNLITTLNNPAPQTNDQFGLTVGISGTTAIVGAELDNPGGLTDAGSAYLFNAMTGALTGTLSDPSPEASDYFGKSVDISGINAAVGAYNDNPGGVNDAGSAFVFDASTTGTLIRTFVPPVPNAFDRFGTSISVNGDLVIVGSVDQDWCSGCGAAYIFSISTGTLLKTLNHPEPGNSSIGHAVAISGDWAAVTSPFRTFAGNNNVGRAYVFGCPPPATPSPSPTPSPTATATTTGTPPPILATPGNLLATIPNPSPGNDDQFGAALAFAGDRLLIGEFRYSPGWVYVVDANMQSPTFGQIERVITNPVTENGGSFGSAIAALPNGCAIIGALGNPAPFYLGPGIAYLFDPATGQKLLTLNNPSPSNYARFGEAVAAVGNNIAVAAPNGNGGAVSSGIVFLFHGETGQLLHTFTHPTPSSGIKYGQSVAGSGTRLIIGCPEDDPLGSNSGRVFIYDADPNSGTFGNLLQTVDNPTTPAASDQFGTKLSGSSSEFVVGMPWESSPGPHSSGRVMTLDPATGGLIRSMVSPLWGTIYEFGSSVCLEGGVVVIGEPGSGLPFASAGAAYLYDAVTGEALLNLLRPNQSVGTGFGKTVAMNPGVIAVGAPYHNSGAATSGAVYLYCRSNCYVPAVTTPSPTPFPTPTPAPAPITRVPLQSYGLGDIVKVAWHPTIPGIAISIGTRGYSIWDANTGVKLRTIEGYSGRIKAFAISPDGKTIALGSSDDLIYLWDFDKSEETGFLQGHTGDVLSLAFADNGMRLISGSADGTAKIWDMTTRSLVQNIFLYPGALVTAVDISSDGAYALTGAGTQGILWKIAGTIPQALYGGFAGGSTINSIQFSPPVTGENMVLVASSDYSTRLFNRNGSWIRTYSSVWGFFADFNSDGTKVLLQMAPSGTSTVRLLNLDGTVFQSYPANTVMTTSALSPDGAWVISGGADRTLRLFDAGTGTQTRVLNGHSVNYRAAAISSAASRIAIVGGSDGNGYSPTIALWGKLNGEVERIITAPNWSNSPLGEVDINLEGSRVAAAPNGGPKTYVYDANVGSQIANLSILDAVSDVKLSPVGDELLVSGFETSPPYRPITVVWDVDGSTETARLFDTGTGSVNSADFSSDTLKVVGGLNGAGTAPVIVWDKTTGTVVNKLYGPPGPSTSVTSVDFSPINSDVAAIGNQGDVVLWHTDSFSPAAYLHFIQPSLSSANTVAFSPSGQHLLTGTTNAGIGSVRLWDAISGTLERIFEGLPGEIEDAGFDQEGTHVFAASRDGSCFLWEIDPPRALLVAAGDPNPSSNALTSQTMQLTGMGYGVLARRGYPTNPPTHAGSDVRILSAFKDAPYNQPIDGDGDGIDDTYAICTKANLKNQIIGNGMGYKGWFNEGALAGRRVFIYMADHGLRQEQENETYFVLNACETLSTAELDSWLDELQDPNLNGGLHHEVILVVDCCFSGEFKNKCAPTGNQKRAIITSTLPTELALFASPPDLTSFSQQFFGAAFMGASMAGSVKSSKDFFSSFTIVGQQPQLVDDHPTTPGLGIAAGFMGTSWLYAGSGEAFNFFGKLGNVSASWLGSPSPAAPGTTVTLTVDVTSLSDPLNVYAQVRSPAPATTSGDAVTTIPLVTLLPTGFPRQWAGQYVVQEEGTYAFGVYGRYDAERRSKPEVLFVSVNETNPEETRPLAAVIVAGQDDPINQTGAIDDQVLQLSARSFHTATSRGYDSNDIAMLGPSELAVLGTNIPDVATTTTFMAKLDELTTPGAKMFISLIGPADPISRDFKLAPGETISPAALAAKLTAMQSADPTLDFIVLIDAPYSGRYRSPLTAPKRQIITSASTFGEGLFLQSPTYQSFSRRFNEASRQGRSLLQSWQSGRDLMKKFGINNTPSVSGTKPGEVFLGRRGVFASDAGELATICRIAPDQLGPPPMLLGDVEIWAEFTEGIQPISVSAQAVVDPPTSDTLVSSAPTINLVLSSPGSNRWIMAPGDEYLLFPTGGPWRVAYVAKYATTDPYLPRLSQTDVTRVSLDGIPTPTPSASPTESPSPTPAPSLTPTNTSMPSPTETESPSPTPSPTPSETPTLTPTETESPSPTPSPTPTDTATASPTETESPSPTPSPTSSETPTASPTETESPSPTPSPTPSESPTLTPTETESPSPTPSPTPTANAVKDWEAYE